MLTVTWPFSFVLPHHGSYILSWFSGYFHSGAPETWGLKVFFFQRNYTASWRHRCVSSRPSIAFCICMREGWCQYDYQTIISMQASIYNVKNFQVILHRAFLFFPPVTNVIKIVFMLISMFFKSGRNVRLDPRTNWLDLGSQVALTF